MHQQIPNLGEGPVVRAVREHRERLDRERLDRERLERIEGAQAGLLPPFSASPVLTGMGQKPQGAVTHVPNQITYSKYFKPVGNRTHIDVYAVHQMFEINDPSGAIQHASKKLLLSGDRNGGKYKYQDIREARDSLNRWLELNQEQRT